jgi:endonuclease YncB( thermonuclease family)
MPCPRLVPILLLPLLIAGCTAADPVPGAQYRATVLWVMDGDSLRARIDGRDYDLRLWGIDAPEREQPGAEAARASLRALADGRTLDATVVALDDYQRPVVRLHQGEEELNRAQIAAGHAWWFRRYAPDHAPYREAEAAARARQRGLWAQVEPEAPWAYRRRQREAAGDQTP